MLSDNHPDVAQLVEKMDAYRDSMGKAEFKDILSDYKNKIKSDSIALLSTQNKLQQTVIDHKDRMLGLAAFMVVILSILGFVWRRNLKLSSENIEILDEQNQKLKIDNLQFAEELDKIRSNGNVDRSLLLDQKISLPTRNNLCLRLGDIMYLQAFGGGVYYVTPEKKHLVWHSFEESIKMLPEELFIKTHRSYIVNKVFIEQISPSKVFLKNNLELPIGVTQKEFVLQRMAE